jgi:peptidoglycan/LPS O-acetylase OafA/YrhL
MAEDVRSEVGYIAPIEGLRGVAVLLVIFFHYVVLRGAFHDDRWIAAISQVEAINRIVHHGYLGVDLFFVISGFLLALPWFVHAREGRAPPSMAGFYRRRFWRIAPAYYVQIAALFVIVLPLLHGWTYWRSDLYVYALNALAHGIFLQNLTPLTSASMGVNGALWTLAVEAQFYLLLPFAAPLFVRRPAMMLILSVIVSWVWRLSFDNDFLRAQLPAYLGHFALGIVLGRAWLERRARASTLARIARTALGRGPLAFVGRVSYSAYLYHLPLLYLWNRYAPFPAWLSLPLYLAALLCLSWFSWRHIEQRFHPNIGVRLPYSGGTAATRESDPDIAEFAGTRGTNTTPRS